VIHRYTIVVVALIFSWPSQLIYPTPESPSDGSPSDGSPSDKSPDTKNSKIPEEIWMHVFIHGTVLVPSCCTYKTFLQLAKGAIYGTCYQKLVSHARNNSFFYQEQIIQDLGLRPLSIDKKRAGAPLFAYLAHQIERFSNLDNDLDSAYKKSFYYTYGWSGLLSPHAREDAARILYHQLGSEHRALVRKHP